MSTRVTATNDKMAPDQHRQVNDQDEAQKENQFKRRDERAGHHHHHQHAPARNSKRPASAIIPSIMGDQYVGQMLGGTVGGATSGNNQQAPSSRQHKLKQRFTVIRKLGKGTYGKVQLAINKETGQEVAIKTIKKTKIENEQDLERVRREIQIMSSIEHPHIIHIYEVFENKDKIVLIMQYAPGGELYEYVSQSKVLDEHEARRLFRQIATAIYYCHQNKICHRDLKLENILLDEKNNAKLADFGLSNVFDKSRQLKTFCGSPLYASPEIVQGSPYEGPEVDCWSLGVLLYTLVYGAMPFDGSNFKRLVKQISEASYYEPKQRSQASPLIGRLLCADPVQRATIRDICLDPWVNGQLPGPAEVLRLSPTTNTAGQSSSSSPQQHHHHHPPLLKVAQDMANLTPVRLDILLALTPNASDQQQQQPLQAQAAVTDQMQTRQPQTQAMERGRAEEDLNKGPVQQQQQQQQKQRELMMDHFGYNLMDVNNDERSTSPVAKYVVRDLVAAGPGEAPSNEDDEVKMVTGDDELQEMKEAEEATAAAAAANLIEKEGTSGVSGSEGEAQEETGLTGHGETGEHQAQSPMHVEEVHKQETEQTDPAIKHDKEAAASVTQMVVDSAMEAAAEPEKVHEHNDSGRLEQRVDEEQQEEGSHADGRAQPEPPTTDEPPITMDIDTNITEAVKTEKDPIDAPSSGSAETPMVPPTATVEPELDGSTQPKEIDSGELEGQDKTAASSGDATGVPAAEGAVESKPKRVKKRIVVVKKKKKVVKKDAAADDNKEQGHEEDTTSEIAPKSSGLDGAETGNKKEPAGPASSGPGKVRIPETFQATNADGGGAPSEQTPSSQPKPAAATRRQSALIADVSQKLLQQQQQDGSQTTSSSAIEMDQHQLASVRVSDTKSEFERRASLAVAAATTAAITPPASTSPRGSERNLTSSPVQQQQHEVEAKVNGQTVDKPKSVVQPEPVAVQTKQEPVTTIPWTTISAEPVIRLDPIEFQQLKVIAPPASEPLTPTNSNQLPLVSHETLAKCADRLSADAYVNREGSRSDSVETIKAESIESRRSHSPHESSTSPSVSGTNDNNNNEKKNIRTSLQINLQGATAAAANRGTLATPASSKITMHQGNQQQLVSTASGQIGPAPIARSYKKVTFTKDGTCVTETGRIYSTQADDGTVRHVERKSKVTHYPSDTPIDSANPIAGLRATEASSHEEIVYESSVTDGAASCWNHQAAASDFQPTSSNRLERLVMPSERFCPADEADLLFHEHESSTGAGSSSANSGSQFYQRNRADSGSSCSSGSTDVFDDIFDTWTGAISMFNQGRHLDELRNSLMQNRRAFVAGSPLGRLTNSSLARRNHSGGSMRDRSGRPQSSGAAYFPDEHQQTSAGLMNQNVFGFGQQPRRHRQRHHHRHSSSRAPSSAGGRSSADPSGYESDVPSFERPGSATLGAARGRFGSSNLFPRPDESGIGFGMDADRGGFFESDNWHDDSGSLLDRLELEHEMMRRRFAQQRMWKGSTPTLHEIPDRGEEFTSGYNNNQEPMMQAAHHSTHQVDPSSGPTLHQFMGQPNQAAHFQQQQQQQQRQQQVKRSSVVCQTSSGASIRQSTPLGSAPVRRNTANLADHLPPRQPVGGPVHVHRSTSRTSIITSQLANIQLSQPQDRQALAQQQQFEQQQQQQHKSASFIELKRNSSSSSFQRQQQVGSRMQPDRHQQQQQQRQHSHDSAASLSSQRHWTEDQMTPTTCNSNTTTMTNRIDPTGAMNDHQQRGAEANSRIQNWLLQSSGNLSISSGSKSSTSDATLPSSSGRSDNTATAYHLASSAGQMMRHEESMRAAPVANTSSTGHPLPPSTMAMRQQQQRQTTRTIIDHHHQLPPMARRSPSNLESRQLGGARSPRPAQPISMIVRSTSRQSMSELDEPGRLERHKVYETVETIVSGGDPNDGSHGAAISRRAQTATSSSAQISSRKVFAYPDSAAASVAAHLQQQQQEQLQRAQIIETRSVTTSSKQVFSSKRTMSPVVAQLGEHDPWAPQQSAPIGGGGVQSAHLISSSRPFDDFNEFDSLIGSAELDSHSSSSLLDQLRSRGYRSIMNQRMVGPGIQQQPQQHQTNPQTTTTTIEPDLVNSSSNSMMTMSSSGVGYGPSCSTEDSPVQVRGQGQQQQQQQQQRNQRAAETIHNDSHDSLTMTTTATKQQPETTNSPAITNESEPRPQVPSHQEAATSNKMWSMGSENCQIDETRAAAMVDPRLAENHQDYQRSFEKTDPQQDTEHQANEGLLDTMKEGEQQATTVPELNGLHDEDRDHHHHQQQQQQQLNGTPTGGDDDVELDEDVREAKANVKEYLDRIRETEKFIKSMHEEEEKFQRQRQESFLFNNLILSTKLNGFAKTSTNGQMNGFDSPIKPSCGPYSAPVTMMSRSSYLIDSPNHHHYASDSLHSNGVGTGCNPTMMGSMVDSSYGGEIIEQPSLSCFNSDLYKPTSSIIHTPLHMLHTPSLLAGSTSAAFAAATTTNYKDPLEPVKPINMHAYAPPARQWHRSKSVLGDRFHSGYDLVSQARKPLSADIDSAHSATSQSNAYFPSRQRRSVSQARYQTPAVPCSTSYAVSSLVPGGSLSSCLDDSTTMVSEYKSSFGPNLHQQYRDRRHQRHHSLAPTSSLSSRPHIQRSTSPYRGSLSSEYKRPAKEAADDIDKDVHDNDDNDDDDPEMNAYRPGSYVPRVVPETWSSSRERGGRGRSISNSRNVLAGARDKSPITKSETTISRRRSVQTMGGRDSSDVSQTIEDTVASDGTVELVAPRRRSWTTTNETNKTTTAGASASAAVSGSGSAGTNSRLSELEQRIQANKRRRAELLQGISSSAAAEEPRRDSKTTWSPSRRRGNHRESDNDEDDEDDELNQSGGFERPSRPVERDTSTQLNHDLSPRRSGSLVPGDGGVGDTRLATAPSSMATNRFRASRIESMEARIKRRSYCVRVKSPERRAMSKCDGK